MGGEWGEKKRDGPSPLAPTPEFQIRRRQRGGRGWGGRGGGYGTPPTSKPQIRTVMPPQPRERHGLEGRRRRRRRKKSSRGLQKPTKRHSLPTNPNFSNSESQECLRPSTPGLHVLQSAVERKRHLIELMTSNRKLEASGEGSRSRIYGTLKI